MSRILLVFLIFLLSGCSIAAKEIKGSGARDNQALKKCEDETSIQSINNPFAAIVNIFCDIANAIFILSDGNKENDTEIDNANLVD